jgi:hypothetical protein
LDIPRSENVSLGELLTREIKALTTPPPILFIHVNRLQYDMDYRRWRRCRVPVAFDEHITLSEHGYSLFAIVDLANANKRWYSLALKPDKGRLWYRFDEYHGTHYTMRAPDLVEMQPYFCALIYLKDSALGSLFPENLASIPPGAHEFASSQPDHEWPSPVREVSLFDEASILENALLGRFSLVNERLARKIVYDVRPESDEKARAAVSAVTGYSDFSLWVLDHDNIRPFDPKVHKKSQDQKKLPLFVLKTAEPAPMLPVIIFVYFFDRCLDFPIQYLQAFSVFSNSTICSFFPLVSNLLKISTQSEFLVFQINSSATVQPVQMDVSVTPSTGLYVFTLPHGSPIPTTRYPISTLPLFCFCEISEYRDWRRIRLYDYTRDAPPLALLVVSPATPVSQWIAINLLKEGGYDPANDSLIFYSGVHWIDHLICWPLRTSTPFQADGDVSVRIEKGVSERDALKWMDVVAVFANADSPVPSRLTRLFPSPLPLCTIRDRLVQALFLPPNREFWAFKIVGGSIQAQNARPEECFNADLAIRFEPCVPASPEALIVRVQLKASFKNCRDHGHERNCR